MAAGPTTNLELTADPQADQDRVTYMFGPFRVAPGRRLLEKDGAAVAVSSRGFDLLVLLIETRDRLMTRAEVIARIWPGLVVDEHNLSVQISTLRRALNESSEKPRYIATVAGRGYRFVGDLREHAPEIVFAPETEPASPRSTSRRWDWRISAGLSGAVAALLGATLWLHHPAHLDSRPRLSLVILPFRNLSLDRTQDYLADAISDDLTTDLSHMPGSLVIARESADTYRNSSVPIAEIGRELNVRYALEGSLRPDGDTLRVNAQLINAETGLHVWAERFDVSRGHLDDAQTAIEGRIRSSLDVELTSLESARSMHDRPKNPDALDCFLRAKSIVQRSESLPELIQAQGLFEKAIALAPDFADAYELLSEVLISKDRFAENSAHARADWARARALVSQALAIQPDNIRALAGRGRFFVFDGKYVEADGDARSARTLNPNDPNALWISALVADYTGKSTDVIKYANDWSVKDPKSPYVWIWRATFLGTAYIDVGDFDKAANIYQDLLASPDNDPRDHSDVSIAAQGALGMISANALAGKIDAARSLYQNFKLARPNRTTWYIAANEQRFETEANLSGHYLSGLQKAGMPEFVDEQIDAHIQPTFLLKDTSMFADTPLSVPGAMTITTAELQKMRATMPGMVIVDAGMGAAVPLGAIWVWSDMGQLTADTSVEPIVSAVQRSAVGGKHAPVVIMGDGPFGSIPYNAVSHVVQMGYTKVYWYRGGEQSWAQTDLPSQDLRP